MSEDRGRLPGDLLRRAAEAILSHRTVENIVIPALADLQHESLRAKNAPPLRRVLVLARGYLAFWAALTLCSITWPARSLREDWLDANAPGPRVLSAFLPRAGLFALVLTTILMLQWPIHWARQAGDPLMAVAALPSILTTTLPIAFLLGLVLAMARLHAGPDRLAASRSHHGPLDRSFDVHLRVLRLGDARGEPVLA